MLDIVEDFPQTLETVGPQHGHARVAEIRNPLEEGTHREVAAYMQYSAVLVDSVDTLGNLPAQYGELVGDCERPFNLPV